MINVSDLIGEYGQFYTAGSQNMERLKRALTVQSTTLQVPGVRTVQTDETVYRAAVTTSGEVMQAYQHGFTPKSDVTFDPNEIVLNHVKVDALYAPDEIEETWLGFLAANDSHPKDWPVVRYLLEEVLSKQIEEDREMNVYLGVAGSPTVGTAGSAQAAMNGFRTQMRQHSGLLQQVAGVQFGGLAQAEDYVAMVEQFTRQVVSTMPQLKNVKMAYFVSPEVEMFYRQGKRNLGLYAVESDSAQVLGTKIDFTNHVLYGVPSMAGSQEIFASPVQNILHVVKKNWDARNFDLQAADRDVKVLGDWYEGVGFGDWSQVFASDNVFGE